MSEVDYYDVQGMIRDARSEIRGEIANAVSDLRRDVSAIVDRREGNAQAQRDSQIASRNRRIEAVRAYDRARGHRSYGVEKAKARAVAYKAIVRGKLTRQPCEVCGETKVDAHHDDYTKPLEVRWLCRRHHMAVHRTVAA